MDVLFPLHSRASAHFPLDGDATPSPPEFPDASSPMSIRSIDPPLQCMPWSYPPPLPSCGRSASHKGRFTSMSCCEGIHPVDQQTVSKVDASPSKGPMFECVTQLVQMPNSRQTRKDQRRRQGCGTSRESPPVQERLPNQKLRVKLFGETPESPTSARRRTLLKSSMAGHFRFPESTHDVSLEAKQLITNLLQVNVRMPDERVSNVLQASVSHLA